MASLLGAANRRERLAAATQRRDEAASLFGLAEGREVEAVYQAIMSMGGPNEFQAYSSEATLGLTVTSGATRIVGMSDNAGSFLPKLLQPLKASTRHYVVTTVMPPSFYVLVPTRWRSWAKAIDTACRCRRPQR